MLLGYSAIAFAYFGARLLPHPGRDVLGSGKDPLIFIWAFAWWPHALSEWTNPLVSHAIYAPEGYNLAWTTTVPALAVAFAPLTLLLGPVVSYNVAAVLLPALAAWTMYLLCRHLTGSTWAALVGGYLFGFSSYILGQQLEGHLHMTGVFPVPLMVLALVRFLDGSLDRRGLTWRIGALVALQLWLSTEVALTMTLALGIGLALAVWRIPSVRPNVRSALAPLAAGYGVALLLASPLLVYALRDLPGRSFTLPDSGRTDAVNLLFPTEVNALGDTRLGSPTKGFNTVEAALYLGLPTLLIVVLFAWRERRSRRAQVLLAALVLPLLVALGPVLLVDGHELFTLPWKLALHVPGLENARLPRLAVYASLAAGLVVALWTARTQGRLYPRPFVLPVLAVAALIPALDRPFYLDHVERNAFFADGVYRSCLGGDENLAIFPYGHGGDSMLWQAESGFRFRLAGGFLYPLGIYGPALTRFDEDPVIRTLNFSDTTRPRMTSLLAFAARHDVDRFVAAADADYPTTAQMRRLGPVERIHGVLVAPACGTPPLTARDLSAATEQDRRWANSGAAIIYCLGGYSYTIPAGLYPAHALAGARVASFVAGRGVTCEVPEGHSRRGFAPAAAGVLPHTYPYWVP